MLRKLGLLVATLALTLPVWSADSPGTISGHVKNASGIPQMGAAVEVFSAAAAQALTVFTDDKGFFSAKGLTPGSYSIKVSAASFLPTWRDGVGLRAGADVLVNITLNTLFDAVKLAPVRGPAEEDDWKWVLRSSANRPILRVVNDPAASGENSGNNHDFKGTLSFLAGSSSDGFGSGPDMSAGFTLERSIFSQDTIGIQGNIGYGPLPPAVVRASFFHKMDNGSVPQLSLTMRNLPAPDIGPHSSSLQAIALTSSDTFSLGDVVELKFGSELQTIQFMGRVTAFRPFGNVDFHLSPNTVIEYRYATSEPDGRGDRGFETAPADLSESGPHVSMVGYTSAVEHAHHHELSLSRRVGKTSLQLAAYHDRIVDPALTGVGEFSSPNGFVLPDIYSGTFTYQGSDLNTQGMRVVVERKIIDHLTATADFDTGGVLDLDKQASLVDAQKYMTTRTRHSIAGKISGTVPKSGAKWSVSYRYIDGQALTPVDMFNESPGQADPYLNIFFRQPIPTGFFPGHLEAMVDVRNLLAEGYVPVMGNDGHTVYLVQSARSVRGGLNFTF